MIKCGVCGTVTYRKVIAGRTATIDDSGLRHKCSGGESKADISIAVETATNKLMSEWVVCMSEMQTLKLEAVHDIRKRVTAIATSTVKKLVPVEHKIVVEMYDSSRAEFSGKPHKELQSLVQLCQLRLHTFLVGPAGSGKTTAVEQVAHILGLPFYSQSMGPSTSEWDLLGYRSPDGHYVSGILREPFENGGVLCLDEMDNTNPNVLTALNSALANGHAQFPDGRITKHPDFICVAGGNTYGRGADRVYVGRMQLDGATLDRFAVLNWDYDEDAELEWAGRDQIEWVSYVQGIRRKAEQLGVRYIFSPRASINGATILRNGLSWEFAERVEIWKGIPEEDRVRLCK
jgi:cobaltochelatase CobS